MASIDAMVNMVLVPLLQSHIGLGKDLILKCVMEGHLGLG